MKVRLLVVALGLSLFANLFLIARSRRAPTASTEPSAAVEKLEARNRELETELDSTRRQLQSRPAPAGAPRSEVSGKSPEPETHGPSGVAIPPTLLETLKKLLHMMKESQKTGKAMDQQEAQDAWAVIAEYWPAMMSPSNKPEKYAEYIGAFIEASMLDSGLPFTEPQKALMAKLAGDVKSKLEAAPDAPGSARQLAEMEAQREHVAAVWAAMTPEQRGSVTNLDLLGLRMGNDRYLSPQTAVSGVVDAWAETLGLDPAQKPMLEGAAQMFAADLDRIQRELNWTGPPRWGQANTDPQGLTKMYDYRVRMMKAQMEAMRRLETSLSPEQRERLGKRRLTEFYPWHQ